MARTATPQERSRASSRASQFVTLHINAAPDTDSHDLFGGSKYSENTTEGLSTGIFGGIEGDLRLPRIGGPGISGGNSSNILPDQEVRCRKDRSNKSSANEEAGDSIFEHHLQPPDGSTFTSPRPSRGCSVSMSNLSSISSEVAIQSCIYSSEPEQLIFERRDTASWFERGKIFEVSSRMSTEVAGHSLIVVGRRGSSSSVICLPLRQHSDIRSWDKDFLKSKVRIYARGEYDACASQFGACPCKPLAIDLDPARALLGDVWINVEEPQTIRSAEVEVALHGVLNEDEFMVLRAAYIDAQDRITNPSQNRQGTFSWHVAAFWRYLKRQFRWLFLRQASKPAQLRP